MSDDYTKESKEIIEKVWNHIHITAIGSMKAEISSYDELVTEIKDIINGIVDDAVTTATENYEPKLTEGDEL